MRYQPPERVNCTMKTESELLPPDLPEKLLEPARTTTSKPSWPQSEGRSVHDGFEKNSIKDIDSLLAEVAE